MRRRKGLCQRKVWKRRGSEEEKRSKGRTRKPEDQRPSRHQAGLRQWKQAREESEDGGGTCQGPGKRQEHAGKCKGE